MSVTKDSVRSVFCSDLVSQFLERRASQRPTIQTARASRMRSAMGIM